MRSDGVFVPKDRFQKFLLVHHPSRAAVGRLIIRLPLAFGSQNVSIVFKLNDRKIGLLPIITNDLAKQSPIFIRVVPETNPDF